jgi:C4-dicarboxylate transporter DctM subunit
MTNICSSNNRRWRHGGHYYTAQHYLHRLRFLLNLPISELFIGGMLPGLLMVIVMMLTCSYIFWLSNWGKIIKFEPMRIIKSGLRANLGFFAIIIVVYGIYSGAFSPTESAGVTVGFFCRLVF